MARRAIPRNILGERSMYNFAQSMVVCLELSVLLVGFCLGCLILALDLVAFVVFHLFLSSVCAHAICRVVCLTS